MKEKILFLFLFIFQILSAQSTKEVDCLNTKRCVDQFKVLIVLADKHSNSDIEKSKNYAYQALNKAKQASNRFYIALAYNSIANVFQYKSDLDSALLYHNKALELRLKCKDSLGIADSYNNIGIVYDTKGQFVKAINNYFKALYFYEKKNDIKKQAMTNTNIGIVYKSHNEYAKSLKYYTRAYNLYLKTDDVFGQTVSSGNLGSILINFRKYKESLKYSKISRLGYEKLGYYRFLGYPISNIAVVYDSLHQFKNANKNYIDAIQIHEKFDNKYEVADISNAYAKCLIKQKEYDQTIIISNKAVKFAKKADGSLLLIQAYRNLSEAYAKLGIFNKAYEYSNLYSLGKDKLFVKDKARAVFELETKYQTEKKEQLLLKKEAEAKQKNVLLIGISSLLALIIVIALLIYRQQRLKNKQQEQEFQLKSTIAQIEKQNELQEQRLSISRDLHDNIGAQLTFIISSVENIKYAFDITNTKLDTKLQGISSFARSTILELRDTIWAMNNNEIHFEDLRVRILDFIEKAKTATEKIDFKFTIEDNLQQEKFSSIAGMNIYRTIQEAVNNAIKYADASLITIDVKTIDGKIAIHIQDDGKGFDEETVEKGNGLLNMQKRIEDIGGIFNLLTAPEKGTSIELLLNKEINL